MIIKDEDIKLHREKNQEKLYYAWDDTMKQTKLYYVWDDTMKQMTLKKNDTIIDIFYKCLASYFSYKEIAGLLNVAVQSVYNYNQLKEKGKQYNNNVRKQLALLFIELLERREK